MGISLCHNATLTMIVGYNQAWFLPLCHNTHYGHDLATDFDLAGVELTFACLRDAGSSHIRLWLCEGNNQFPEGVEFKNGIAQGLQPDFVANVATVMDCAQKHNIKVYWTLLAPNTGYQPQAQNPKLRGPLPEFRQWYTQLFDIQSHPYHAISFIEQVLLPLVDLLRPYREHVFGLDLVNEIDYVAATYLPAEADRMGIMGSWLDAVQRMVHTAFPDAPRLGVSFGYEHQHYPMLYYVDELDTGLDFLDIHAYHDEGKLSLSADKPIRKPLVLGEFGHRSPTTPRMDEPERQAKASLRFLEQATQRGFEAAFAWRLLEDHRSHWSHFEVHTQSGRLQIGPMRPAAHCIRQWNTPKV